MLQESKDLFVEIGVEELPASYIKPALDSWAEFFNKVLAELKLILPETEIAGKYSTPRRLTLHIKNIKTKQEDEETEKVGPSINVSFDKEGKLTKAGQGFLRGAKLGDAELNYDTLARIDKSSGNKPFLKSTSKGEYLAVNQVIIGQEAEQLLKDVCKQSLTKINFPKMMRWKERKFRFARPIRWILALFGDDVLSFEIAGVKSDRITYGNIFAKRAERLTVSTIKEYAEILKNNGVIADRNQRLIDIDRQVNKKAAEIEGIVEDKALLGEVTDIVEYPTAILSRYPEEYLKLPEKVVYSTLAKNQRYFPVYDRAGKLLNYFVYVANNLSEYAANTKAGNERVVNARLADARFYYEEDISKSADYFNSKLQGIVFHARVGSIGDKVVRIIEISRYLCRLCDFNQTITNKTVKTARLCKFDLATSMIGEKEFTGLQGYVGKVYAAEWGEDVEIAKSIEEHYLPVGLTNSSATGAIPSTKMGQVVSLADKLDTLCALFGIGVVPTGSKDQYGLRRTGNSIVRLIYEAGFDLDIYSLILYVYELLSRNLPKVYHLNELTGSVGSVEILYGFLKQRIGQYLQQASIEYDVINAVLAIESDNIVKTINRAKALHQIRSQQDFEHLMLSFKRVSNIISKEEDFIEVNEDLLMEPAEKYLYQVLLETNSKAMRLLKDNEFSPVLELFITMNAAIDSFFDHVLVNDDDLELRKNRYALLNLLRELFLNIGDLSLIVVDQPKTNGQ